jgi:hypothetical protein
VNQYNIANKNLLIHFNKSNNNLLSYLNGSKICFLILIVHQRHGRAIANKKALIKNQGFFIGTQITDKSLLRELYQQELNCVCNVFSIVL